jgi:CHAT domain-containing protein/tetratricopeptide (TPR) repeat protein
LYPSLALQALTAATRRLRIAKALLALGVVAGLLLAISGRAQSPAKPPYERLLVGKDAERAAELDKRILAAENADNYPEAIRLAEELLDLRTQRQGSDHWERVNQRWKLQQIRSVAALPPEQRAGWRKARDGLTAAQKFDSQGQALKAEPLRRERLKWCQSVLDEKHRDTATSYNDLASNLYAQGKYAQAQPLYQKALDIRLELLGEKHPDTAESYNDLANNLGAQGKYAEAQPLLQNALDLLLELLGEKHPHTALSYNNLASNLAHLGKHAQAQPLYQKALDLLLELLGEKHPNTATSYNTLATNLIAQGKYAEAQPLLQKALDLRHELFGEKHPHIATSYNNLALNLSHQGKYAEAQPLLQKALDLWLALLGEKHPLTAVSYNNLAYNLGAQDKYAQAQPLYQKALDIRLELLGEKHPENAQSYNNLAVNLIAQGKYAEAEALLKKALDLYRELLGEKHPDSGRSYNNLALNLIAQRRYAEAAELVRQGAAAFEAARLNVAAGGLERAVYGAERSPYPVLAATEARLGARAAAWVAAESDLARGLSEEAATRRGVALTPSERQVQSELAAQLSGLQPRLVQLVSKQRPSEADKAELTQLKARRAALEDRLTELAVNLGRRERGSLKGVQSALAADAALVLWVDVSSQGGGVREHWGCVVRRTEEPMWQQLPGSGPEAKWTEADESLPERLREALSTGALPASEIDQLAKRLHRQRLAPLVPHLQGVKTLYVIAVNRMAGIPIEVLTNDYTTSYVPSGTFFARLSQQSSPASVGLLALGDPDFARPGTRSKKPADDLPPGGLLITQVAPASTAASVQLQSGDVLVRYANVELHSVDDLTKAIAAHGSTKSVPLTVWRSGVEKPFVRDVAPGRLGVALDRAPAREALVNRRNTEIMLTALRAGDWKDLPATRAEVTHVTRLFGSQATTLLDSAASEQTLDELRKKDQLRRYRYLHLATHGEANNVRAFDSALILAQDRIPETPLPRAGEPFLNGQLSAGEVLEFWKLDAELVTLSACETAIGRAGGGEGMLGFAQAFLTAGARSVCLSLWKVDDSATALLMTRFYQNLLGKRSGLKSPMPKATALAEAKRWLRDLSAEEALQLTASITQGVVRSTRGKDEPLKLVIPAPDPKKPAPSDSRPYAHPRYWSAFILIGDPD